MIQKVLFVCENGIRSKKAVDYFKKYMTKNKIDGIHPEFCGFDSDPHERNWQQQVLNHDHVVYLFPFIGKAIEAHLRETERQGTPVHMHNWQEMANYTRESNDRMQADARLPFHDWMDTLVERVRRSQTEDPRQPPKRPSPRRGV